jgi:cyclopropane-fatty-acyl-phospholipid synthase
VAKNVHSLRRVSEGIGHDPYASQVQRQEARLASGARRAAERTWMGLCVLSMPLRPCDDAFDLRQSVPMTAAGAISHSRAIMRALFGEPGVRPFDVSYWDGSTENGRAHDFTLVINRPGALRRMLLPPSEISIVEAFLSGDVDVEGELVRAVTLGDAINSRLRSAGGMARLLRHLLALPKNDATADVRAVRAEHTVQQAGRRHDQARDQSAIQYHYDVGNDFYALWLDERMVYSCAYWASPAESLETAQVAKLDLVCRKLRLQPTDRLLDVGCGWGALVIHAAQHYGVTAVGITLSEAQAALARERTAAAGVSERCTIELRDYRALPPSRTFDKISSVGMVEHVGVENLPQYFSVLHGALAEGGLLLNHGIVNVAESHPRRWRERLERRLWRRDEFIDQYVFPDGKLGPLHAVIGAAEGAGFETRDVQSLREHYVLTLREWLRRLLAHADEARTLVGDRRFRVWRLYMAAAMHGFASGRLNVVQTLLAKPDASGAVSLPLIGRSR